MTDRISDNDVLKAINSIIEISCDGFDSDVNSVLKNASIKIIDNGQLSVVYVHKYGERELFCVESGEYWYSSSKLMFSKFVKTKEHEETVKGIVIKTSKKIKELLPALRSVKKWKDEKIDYGLNSFLGGLYG